MTSSKKSTAHARTVPENRVDSSTAAAASSPLVERADVGRPNLAADSPYPSVFFNDDLSAAPLYPPPLRRTPPRELPRVELEHSHREPVGAGMPESPYSSSDELRIEHAYPDSSGMPIPMADDDERWDAYRTQSAPPHRMVEWNDEEDGYADDDSDDFTSSSGYSADESPYSEDEERSSSTGQDEPRPFPNPRLKTQQKYLRPPEHDLEHPPASRTYQEQQQQHGPHTPASYLLSHPTYSPPTQAAVTAYPYVPSLPASALSHLSPYASPLMSPTATTPHEVRVEAVPSNLPSPTSEHAPHYDPAAFDEHAAAVAGQYYAAPVYEDVRGRNPHPRLLWRSVIDRDALEILDAHHERVRGGPLPRLALAKHEAAEQLPAVPQPLDQDAQPVQLGASGLEREREHTGVGDDEMKERVRRARARRNDPNRRTWSQAGRQWSRQIEKCGL